MSKENAYSLFEAIAEINGFEKNLKVWEQTEEAKAEEIIADEVKEINRERLAPFRFSLCSISVGEETEFSKRGNPNDGVKVHVVDDRHVAYENQVWSLTGLAKFFMNTKKELAGPEFFKYKGEWLNDIRER